MYYSAFLAILWFIVFIVSSWFNTNEIRSFFVKSIENVSVCMDDQCPYHNNNIHFFTQGTLSFQIIHPDFVQSLCKK